LGTVIEVGQYIRTSDGVGYIFGKDDDNQYEIALVRRDEEVTYSAADLIAWTPEDGEHVVETEIEFGVDGKIVNTKLEPVWSADAN
jgi:hypothetical protein